MFKYAKILKKLFSVAFLIFLAFCFYGFFEKSFSQDLISSFLGLAVICFSLSVAFWQGDLFFNLKLKRPSLKFPDFAEHTLSLNLAELLSFDSLKAVANSLALAKDKGFLEANSSMLFYFLLLHNPKLDAVLFRAMIDTRIVEKSLKLYFETLKRDRFQEVYSPDFQKTIISSLKIAKERKHDRIETGDLIFALAQEDPIFKNILIEVNLKPKDIGNLVWWLESIEKRIEFSKKFWEWTNLIRLGSLAKEWTAGYTIYLDQFSVDWTEIVKRSFPEVIGHKNEVEEVERILSRSDNKNVLLVGDPGTGRRSIVLALALRSLLGQSLPTVNHKRVVQLDLQKLLAGQPSLEEAEATLEVVLKEVFMAGNVILFIDDFHNYVGQGRKPGVIDISGQIASYLKNPQFQIVALTTYEGLHRNIEPNSSLLNLFKKVEVSEISEDETLMLLERQVLILERKYKKMVTYNALKEIISLTGKYLPALHFPEKALDILDETMIFAASSKEISAVLPEHVAQVLTQKTQIPIGELKTEEKEVLLNLEKLIHQRIVNQEEAVKEIASALRRARANITVRKGPMGVFLFLGPTGVGKTESAKALAEFYFGSEEKMIRLDMSEFQSVSDIPRLIGSLGQEGLLTTPVTENPFSLVLLDEFEKAHPNILNLFLQVFDEGHLTDGQGRKVDFKNSIIIATSNAGYQVILEAIKKGKPMPGVKEELLDFLFKQGAFRPELINRFDAVVVFRGLSKEHLLQIADLLFNKLKKNLNEKEIDFIVSQALKEKIIELGYNPVFGAREMRRVIQDKVENVIAQSMLKGELIRGSRFEINPGDFSLVLK